MDIHSEGQGNISFLDAELYTFFQSRPSWLLFVNMINTVHVFGAMQLEKE